MKNAEVSSEVQRLVEENKQFLELKTVKVSNPGSEERVIAKVYCKVTERDIPATVSAIQLHLKSKGYVKARDWYSHDFKQYEPYLVPHRRNAKALYCNVTEKTINRIPDEVNRHVNGKKYLRLKQEFDERLQRKKSVSHNSRQKPDGKANGGEDDGFDISQIEDELLGVKSDEEKEGREEISEDESIGDEEMMQGEEEDGDEEDDEQAEGEVEEEDREEDDEMQDAGNGVGEGGTSESDSANEGFEVVDAETSRKRRLAPYEEEASDEDDEKFVDLQPKKKQQKESSKAPPRETSGATNVRSSRKKRKSRGKK